MWKLCGCTAVIVALFLVTIVGCDIDIIENDDQVNNTNYSAEEIVRFSVPVTGQQQFRLEGISGEVNITGTAHTDSVKISALKQVRSESREDARDHLGYLRVTLTNRQNEVFAKITQPSESEGRSYIVDYTISLPDTFEISVSSVNGPVRIDSVLNSVDTNNVNGTLSVQDVVGDVSVNLVNGQIFGTQVLPLNGRIDYSVVNGEIMLHIPRNTSAEISANVVNGNISTTNLNFSEIESAHNYLLGKLGNGEGEIRLEVVNGIIRVSGN